MPYAQPSSAASGEPRRTGIFVRLLAVFLVLGCCVCALPAPCSATGKPAAHGAKRHLSAGVFLSTPFVMSSDGKNFHGMLPDLWHAIEERLNLSTTYTVFHDLEKLLAAARDGQVDFVFTNLDVTYERTALLDFTYPWLDSGLRIMINEQSKSGSVLEELHSSGQLHAYAWMFGALFFIVLLLTLFRRRVEPDFSISWRDGLATTLHDLIFAAKSGQIPVPHPSWLAKLAAAAWMLFGVAIIAYITSSVTSAMTTVSLTHEINSVFDLKGKTVGVPHGSEAEHYLTGLGLKVVPFAEPDMVFEAFRAGKLRAVVMDAPMLEYYVHMNPHAGLKVVGKTFNPDKYAFGFTKKHRHLVAEISREIIRMSQNGVLDKLKTTYFGVHQ